MGKPEMGQLYKGLIILGSGSLFASPTQVYVISLQTIAQFCNKIFSNSLDQISKLSGHNSEDTTL